ncbi:response regulator [Flaviaesturariibacter amylovorans]|uniref:Response regulator n=1 Tax=Flaviaesturariibacter amylovorans TaxID=1084520 RepID=A0ABP8GCH5_9BACT
MSTRQLILWVDDDLDDLEIFTQAAAEVCPEAEVHYAHNGLEALTYLERAKSAKAFPDLVILDMNMPKLGGRETLASIKSNPDFQQLNVIVFTTSSSPLDALFCEKYGAEIFIKPQSYEHLKEFARRFFLISSGRA